MVMGFLIDQDSPCPMRLSGLKKTCGGINLATGADTYKELTVLKPPEDFFEMKWHFSEPDDVRS